MIKKEKLLDAYFPSELILVKENGKYRFAVHYFPGVPAVKILHNNKDVLNENVTFASFILTDPNRNSPRSSNRTAPFASHFVLDFAYCTPFPGFTSSLDMKNFNYVIAPVCKSMMDHQKQIEHVSSKLSVRDILAYEDKLNAAIRTTSEIEK